MKIYRAEYYDSHDGNCLEWFETKGAAESFIASLDAAQYDSIDIVECEIKPTRRGIVEWLSSQGFAETNNG